MSTSWAAEAGPPSVSSTNSATIEGVAHANIATINALRDYALLGRLDLPAGAEYDASYGLSVGYTLANGVGLTAEWITRELDFNGSAWEDAPDNFDAYGIGVSYDLGGGATLAGAVMKNELYGDNETRADTGVKFKF